MPDEAGTEEITDETVESTEGQTEEAEAVEELDPSQLSWVVTRDGKEEEVTLDELLKGYMRQSDYTRKTQSLSQQRQEAEQALRIQQALQTNPKATIAQLMAAYQVDADTVDYEDDDPAAVRVRELEARIEAFETAQRTQAVDREVNALALKYGDDVDVAAVMQHAIQNNLPSLEASFKDLFFDDFHGVAKTAVSKKAKEDLKVRAKRAASVVSTGGSAGGTTREQVQVEPGRKLTIEESWAYAKQGKQVAPWSPN